MLSYSGLDKCRKTFSVGEFRYCNRFRLPEVQFSVLDNGTRISFRLITMFCWWYVSIVATCIAAHFAVCYALYNNKNKKIGKIDA